MQNTTLRKVPIWVKSDSLPVFHRLQKTPDRPSVHPSAFAIRHWTQRTTKARRPQPSAEFLPANFEKEVSQRQEVNCTCDAGCNVPLLFFVGVVGVVIVVVVAVVVLPPCLWQVPCCFLPLLGKAGSFCVWETRGNWVFLRQNRGHRERLNCCEVWLTFRSFWKWVLNGVIGRLVCIKDMPQCNSASLSWKQSIESNFEFA